MSSKESKIFAFQFGKKWVWILTIIVILGIMYIGYNAYYAASEVENVDDDIKEQRKSIPQNTINLLYAIPFFIQATGSDFNPNLVNDHHKFDSYTIYTDKAAVNLGVYTMDIGYLSTYGKTQQALNYMDACLKLKKTVYGPDLRDLDALARFERNLSNPDSLIQIINQFINQVIRYSVENEHGDYAALMLAGAFIEAQFITTQIIDTYPKNLLPGNMIMQVLSPLYSILLDQKESLMVLIELLENVEGKGDLELTILIDLKELYYIYDNYPKYKFYPHPKEPMNESMFKLLLNEINNIRSDIIS